MEKSVRSSSLLTVIAVVFLFLTNHSAALKLAAFLPFVLIPVHAFEVLKYDAMSGWNKYELVLPISRKRVVGSKYLTFLLLVIFSFLLVFSISFVVHTLMFPTIYSVFLNYSLRGMGLIICIAAIIYPFTYKLGTDKSDSIMMGSVGFSLGMFFAIAFIIDLIGVEGFDEKFSTFFFMLSIIFLTISYIISVNIYINKEY
ncbi:ABC-2 transporter permease [Ornithinibacillus massiliensis]|uniref:ABC-2 transporter permease n=1 Tax=Ornithinibacillus massiliensis TaxID=1944633 RepID=UPI001BA5E21A